MSDGLLMRAARAVRAGWRRAPSAEDAALRAVGRLREGQSDLRSSLKRQDAALARIAEQVAGLASAGEVATLAGELRELRRATGVQARATARALRHADLEREQHVWAARIERRVRRASDRGGALAGPWTGEVGFEVLYWVPFLRRLASRLDGGAALTVLTRGGAGVWYGDFATATVDLLASLTPDALRQATEGESRKQRRFTAADRRMLAAARHVTGAGLVPWHPVLLYGLLYPYLKDQTPARTLFEDLEFRRLDPPRVAADLSDLPPRYVAVRFYFSQCFPDTPDNRAFVRRVVEALARRGPVVLLDSPFAVDDHTDAPLGDLPVVRVSGRMQPADNLAVQSAVIAGAAGFVGTYGGFSYLAPFYGVPAVAFYERPTFFPHHLDVARRAFDQLGVPGLTLLRVGEIDLALAALG